MGKREQRGALLQPFTRPFLSLADDSICLACASPLSTNCGFSNFSLCQSADAEHRWRLEMQSCTCEQCEIYASESLNQNDLQDGMARERLLDRHRFSRLDKILGVDEPIESVALRPPNRVPVLALRQMLAACDVKLGLYPDEEALTAILCSFEQTTAFITTRRGQELLRARVFDRQAELDTNCQLTVPKVVVQHAEYHYYYSAALFRVAVAYDHLLRLTDDMRWRYSTDSTVQECVLHLQLFIDTHLELMVMCDAMGGIYNDDWLTEPTSRNVALNLPPLPDNASGEQWRERRDLQRRALMSDAVYFSPLECAYPHPLRAVWAGELINYSASLVQSNIWTAVRELSISDTSRSLHAFLGKAALHKCLKRNLDIMLSQEIGAQPVLVPVINNLFETTQLGNYPGARYRPLLRARLCTRRSYHWEKFELHTWCAACHKGVRAICPKCVAESSSGGGGGGSGGAAGETMPSIDGRRSTSQHANHLCDVCQFLRHNKYLILFAIKEFYVFSVREQGLINTMLELESGWNEHCALLLHALDDSRRIMSRAFTDRHNPNPDVVRRAMWRASRHMILMHDCNKPTMRRLFKSPYMFEQMLGKMHRYHNKELVVWQWTGCQQPEDFLVAPLLRDRNDAAAFPTCHGPRATKQFYACDEPLAHLHGKRWCDVYTLENVDRLAQFCVRKLGGDIVASMLSVVGMSPHACALLEMLCFNSSVRDLPDNKLYKECTNIGSKYMTDFHLLHYYLRLLKRHHAVSSFALDAHQTNLQARALRLRHKIDPWGLLPTDTYKVAVCRNDEQVFTSIVEATDLNEIDDALAKDGSAIALDETIFARGVTSAHYDHARGALVCPRDFKSANAKRWRKCDQQKPFWFEGNASEELTVRVSNALSVRTSLEKKRECERQPLEYHSLLGSVLCVGNRAITLCVKCGAVCYFQDTCMSTNGMCCGREVRFAERERYSAVQQFATVQTHTLRTRDDNGLFDVRETILLAPPTHGKRDRRAELFDRVTTPVFDRRRGYDNLLFINARSAAPRALIDKSNSLMKEDVTYLLDGDGNDEDNDDKSALGVIRSRASRPRNSRKQKALATDEIPAAAAAHSADAMATDVNCQCGGEEDGECACGDADEDDVTASAPILPTESDESVVPMKLSERQARVEVPYAERHRVQPHNYTESEWSVLSDELKMIAWTNDGRMFREQFLALKQQPAEKVMRTLSEMMLHENERVARLKAERFYEKEMRRMRAIDECIESEARARRTLCLDNFADEQIEEMRQFFIEGGMMEARHDIACAFCKMVCDPRGQFKRISVINLDNILVNPLTGKPIKENGVVQIYLCMAEFKHVERMLRDKELPLANDVFLMINARRQRARDQALRNKGGKR